MGAQIFKFGESPPVAGGDYEKFVAQTLQKELSHKFLIITNPSFPTRSSFFYEYDIILLSPFYCEVIEIKYIYRRVKVYEDSLVCVNNLQIPGIFSKLENKGKVLGSKLTEDYLWNNPPFVKSRVIVGPPETQIIYKDKRHKRNNKLVKLHEAINIYKDIEKNHDDSKIKIDAFKKLKAKIKENFDNLQNYPKKSNRIGRFHIKRVVEKGPSHTGFWAQDEPPCSVDVYLKEYPFENLSSDDDIETYLDRATHGMQVLRSLRHQYISCVIGHFQTGCSLVQINDWFDGILMSERWKDIEGLAFSEKISLMIKIAQGIGYCHEKGKFHRNICAEAILVNNELDDLRITGFDYAKDIEDTKTLSTTLMNDRNNLLIPPEELITVGSKVSNLRLYDIYQAGLLFYGICENGSWPFEDPMEYCTGEGKIKERCIQTDEKGAEELTTLIKSMLSIKPQNRPELMQKVEDGLRNALELSCSY